MAVIPTTIKYALCPYCYGGYVLKVEDHYECKSCYRLVLMGNVPFPMDVQKSELTSTNVWDHVQTAKRHHG